MNNLSLRPETDALPADGVVVRLSDASVGDAGVVVDVRAES